MTQNAFLAIHRYCLFRGFQNLDQANKAVMICLVNVIWSVGQIKKHQMPPYQYMDSHHQCKTVLSYLKDGFYIEMGRSELFSIVYVIYHDIFQSLQSGVTLWFQFASAAAAAAASTFASHVITVSARP